MWLDIIDKGELVNLAYIERIILELKPDDQRWVLSAVSHTGAVHCLTAYKDSADANRALDRIRHALQTVVLSSDEVRTPQ